MSKCSFLKRWQFLKYMNLEISSIRFYQILSFYFVVVCFCSFYFWFFYIFFLYLFQSVLVIKNPLIMKPFITIYNLFQRVYTCHFVFWIHNLWNSFHYFLNITPDKYNVLSFANIEFSSLFLLDFYASHTQLENLANLFLLWK